MKLTILQTNIAWADPCRNLDRAESLMDAQPDADVFLLPEMFSTGFCMQPEGVAEEPGGPVQYWMSRKAKERGAAVAGSVIVREGGNYYNRFCFAMPDGSMCHYDKRHLFRYGGEDARFTPGAHRVTVRFREACFLPLVCYDLRFPVWARCRNDYEVMLCVANWPAARTGVWEALLRARAIENQCYVAGVNRVGSDPMGEYAGNSLVIDPYGRTMAQCPVHQEGAASAELRLHALAGFRQKFPALDDADDFILG